MDDHRTHHVGDSCLPDGHRSDPTLADLRVGDGAGGPVVGRLRRMLENAPPSEAYWRLRLPALLDIAKAARPIVAHGYSQGENGWVTNAAEVHDLLAALARLEETR